MCKPKHPNIYRVLRRKARKFLSAQRKLVRETGCWEWKGHLNWRGYGVAIFRDTQYSAHRLAYNAWKGDIPSGMTIDHLCKNKRCFNPAHLEPATNRTNNRRAHGSNATDDTCMNGHPYAVGSHYISKRNRVICLECERERSRKRRDKGTLKSWGEFRKAA